MILNSSKLLFIIMLVIRTIITIRANNWLGIWIGLEINLISFIPFISKIKNKKSSQAIIIYFLRQSIGRIILLFAILTNSLIFINPYIINELIKIIIIIRLIIKVGIAPFHFWLPEIISNLNWLECSILITWQKIAPLTIINNTLPNNLFIYFTVVLSAAVGAIGGLNQTSLRKILAYSSINHLGWIIIFISIRILWYKYLIIYSILIIIVCYIFYKKNAFFINQLIRSSPSLLEKYTYVVVIIRIGGLPPFLGFLPKWIVIQRIINSNLLNLLIIIILLSLLTLFYYLRIISSFILSYSCINKISLIKRKKISLFIIWLINLLLPLFSILSFF